MSLNPVYLTCSTLPDAWFQAVYNCLKEGKEFKIDRGSFEGDKRLEFDHITIHIKYPNVQPLLPKLPAHYNIPDPVSEDYLNDYLPYIMTDKLKKGEIYSYGNRLHAIKSLVPYDHIKKVDQEKDIIKGYTCTVAKNATVRLNQIEYIIHEFKKYGVRSNQNILQIAQPSDLVLVDPPCLRSIFCRIQDNKLHFHPYFRSNDLWSGFSANLAAIQMLKEYMAAEIGVEDGEIIYTCSGLHLYSYVWELAEIIRGKTIKEFRAGK